MSVDMFKVKEIFVSSDPDFSGLYANVWKQCFPLDLLPFKAFRGKIRERKFKEGVYHIFVVKNQENTVIAGISFYFFCKKKTASRSGRMNTLVSRRITGRWE